MRRFLASLRARLLFLVLLALAPILGLTLYNNAEQRAQAATQAQERALRLARRAASEQDRLVEGARQLLIALAQLPSVQEGDAAKCSAFMAELLQQYPLYENLGAADLDGDIFCSGVPSERTVNMADRSFFQRTLQWRGFVAGEFIIARISGLPTLPFAYPALDASGQVRAVVFAGINLHWLNDLLAAAQLPEGSTLTLVNSRGTILAHYPGPSRVMGNPVSPTMRETLVEQKEGITEATGEDGVPYLYAFTTLCCLPGSEDIYVRVGIPRSAAFAEVNRLAIRNLVVLGLVTLLVLGIAWMGSEAFVLRQVNFLLQATERLTAGDLSTRVGLSCEGGELRQLACAFDQMAEALEKREQAYQQAVKALQSETRARAALLERTVSAQEDERRRIARELHDETSQSLAALVLDLNAANLALAAGEPAEAIQRLQISKAIAERLLDDVHRLIRDLRPSLLDDLGLSAAIAWYGEQRLKPLGIAVEFQHDGVDRRLPDAIETAVFRIAQEAIANVVKHAEASKVRIALQMGEGCVTLAVEDDGKGFDIPRGDVAAVAGSRGMGLQSIQERVSTLGGELTIRSAPGGGTSLSVRIPLSEDESSCAPNAPADCG